MPLAQKPHRPKADVELLRRERIAFETAEDLLRNAVGTHTKETNIADLVQSKESAFDVPASVLVSFRNIPAAAKSLADDWVTWSTKRRPRRSCFVKVTGRLETHLHPYYLSRLGLGLRGAAGLLLHRWSDPLRCIPLGFVELKPASSYAAVVAESPYVHFLMHFVAVGFAPQKGDWVVGRLSETQVPAGINVTLLGLMNCHVRKWTLPGDLRFCRATSRWLDVRNAEDDVAGREPQEDGSVRGTELTRVWLRLEEDTWVDHFNVSGQHFEFRCSLGWPPESIPRYLKQARAEEEEAIAAKRNGKAAASKAAAGGTKPMKLKAAAAEETPLATPKKVKKESAPTDEPSSSRKKPAKEEVKEEPGEFASPKKPKKSSGKLQAPAEIEEPSSSKKRAKEEAKEPEESASAKKPKKSSGKPEEVKQELDESASPKKPKKSLGKLQAEPAAGEAPPTRNSKKRPADRK